jgi:hypothetical protein
LLLSHVHRFIYTKTVKTAGTSVEIYFENACLPPGHSIGRGHHTEQSVTPQGVIGYRGGDRSGRTWYNHMPANEIRALAGDATWNEYYKFCVVRNPFDKMVSLWWFINSKQEHQYHHNDFARIKTDFSRWCVGHAPDAIDRDKYLIDGQISMDFIIRYEFLFDGLESVCRQVGYPFQPELLGKFKSDSRLIKRPFGDYYDQPAIAAVESAFGWELDHFGYSRLSATVTSS